MKSTDKYYPNDKQFNEKCQRGTQAVIEALCADPVKVDLCMEDINALARFLYYAKEHPESAEARTAFESVADFLWMSYRIGLDAKHRLLGLLEN